jgi:lipopolysaccharide export system protein LptA
MYLALSIHQRLTVSAPIKLIACVIGLGLAGSVAHAQKNDTQEPIQIWANASSYDGIKKLNVYSGNVQLVRGGMELEAEKLEIKEQKNGGQLGIATANKNGLVKFKQKRQGSDETIQGEAEYIEYNSQTELLILRKRAQIRRLIGNTVQDEVSADQIQYGAIENVFSASGGPQQGRVKAVLSAKNDQTSEKPAPPQDRPAKGLTPNTNLMRADVSLTAFRSK